MPLSYIGVAIPARLERAASSFAKKRSESAELRDRGGPFGNRTRRPLPAMQALSR